MELVTRDEFQRLLNQVALEGKLRRLDKEERAGFGEAEGIAEIDGTLLLFGPASPELAKQGGWQGAVNVMEEGEVVGNFAMRKRGNQVEYLDCNTGEEW